MKHDIYCSLKKKKKHALPLRINRQFDAHFHFSPEPTCLLDLSLEVALVQGLQPALRHPAGFAQ